MDKYGMMIDDLREGIPAKEVTRGMSLIEIAILFDMACHTFGFSDPRTYALATLIEE